MSGISSNLILTSKASLLNTPVEPSRYIVVEQTKELYYDTDKNERTKLRDIQILREDKERELCNPFDYDLYYVIETSSFWFYNKGWTIINDDGNSITIDDVVNLESGNPISNSAVARALNNKVDVVRGKGLSSNDLTNGLKENYDSAVQHMTTVSNPHNTTLDQVIIANNVTTHLPVFQSGFYIGSGERHVMFNFDEANNSMTLSVSDEKIDENLPVFKYGVKVGIFNISYNETDNTLSFTPEM